jgi:hypothetical protein
MPRVKSGVKNAAVRMVQRVLGPAYTKSKHIFVALASDEWAITFYKDDDSNDRRFYFKGGALYDQANIGDARAV